MTTIQDIITDAITDLEDQFEPDMQYPEDLCAEIADGAVPIYYNEIAEVGQSDSSLLTDEPELGAASGTNFTNMQNTAIAFIAANIYERVSNALHKKLYELQEELETA